MASKKDCTYVVTVTIRSQNGTPPDVRTLMGDTVFIRMDEGQDARWNVKKKPKKRKPH